MKSRLVMSTIITMAVLGSLVVGPVLADGSQPDQTAFGYGYRPGWGFGDENHIHTGPPGQVGKDDNGRGNPHGEPPGQAKK